MQLFPPSSHAVIVGASGGVGAALTEALLADDTFDRVTAMARRPDAISHRSDRLHVVAVDVEQEASIEQAFGRLIEPPRLVLVATGILHDGSMQPEKAVRTVDPAAIERAFRVNATGPLLVAKHCLARMPRTGPAVFAALGARVGSIADNRSGGWYAYRASKAALAMIVRTLAIESARTSPELICVGLHPGTVDTGLSLPFSRAVPAEKLFTPAYAAARLLDVIDGLTPGRSGSTIAWDGSIVPP